MNTFEWLAERITAIETDALHYHAAPGHSEYAGNVAPRATEAYSEAWDHYGEWPVCGCTRPPFVFVDVVYHAKGWSALYELDTRTGAFTVAQD